MVISIGTSPTATWHRPSWLASTAPTAQATPINTYAQARTELDFGSHKTTTLYKGLQQRLFTAELTATLGICDIIGVYASWSPMTLFQSPYGPRLRSWSIGGTINF